MSAAREPSAGLSDDASRELAELYARVDAEVASHSPRCEMSGRCCDFPRNDHKLYATGLETEFARERAGNRVPHVDSGLCPWHVDGLCQLREGRPLGCRLYFCDPDWAEPMPRVYERAHAEITALHERHGLTYSYAEFVHAVREDGDGAPNGDRAGDRAGDLERDLERDLDRDSDRAADRAAGSPHQKGSAP